MGRKLIAIIGMQLIYCGIFLNPLTDGKASVQSIIQKKRMRDSGSDYEGILCVLPTSNIVERFFSTAGIALSDYRHRLLPANLECQLFLKYNSRLWDKKTLKFVINHTKIAEQ